MPEKLRSIDFRTQPPAFKFFLDNGIYYLCLFPVGPALPSEPAFGHTISQMHFLFIILKIYIKVSKFVFNSAVYFSQTQKSRA
ncbi:hypothetical protein AOG23_24395 [Rhizobium acidisoli]|nr:hypothetical protein AOG23_24395 [Rhizobium acidisoli]